MSHRPSRSRHPVLRGQLLEPRFVFSAAPLLLGSQSVDDVVAVERTESSGLSVHVSLQFTDDSGNPVTSVDSGEEFQVRINLEDLRSISDRHAGVVSAYMNLLFDSDLVEMAGPLTFGETYTFLSNKGTATDGEIADINAASDFIAWLDGNTVGFGEKLFATIPFRVREGVTEGVIRFETHRSHAIGAEVNMFAGGGGTFQAALDPAAGEIEYGAGLLAIGDSDPNVLLERLPTDPIETPVATLEQEGAIPPPYQAPTVTLPSGSESKPHTETPRSVDVFALSSSVTFLYDELGHARLATVVDDASHVVVTEASMVRDTRDSDSRSNQTGDDDSDIITDDGDGNAIAEQTRDQLMAMTIEPTADRTATSLVLDHHAGESGLSFDELARTVESLADESLNGIV